MRKAIANLDKVLVIAIVSKSVMPVRVPTGQVFSHALAVFANDSFADQAVLSSSLHQMWAIKYGSTLETRVRYTPSDVFETFPRPEPSDRLEVVGRTLDTERRGIMLRRDLGLTKLYNLVNDPDYVDDDIDRGSGERLIGACSHAVNSYIRLVWQGPAETTMPRPERGVDYMPGNGQATAGAVGSL